MVLQRLFRPLRMFGPLVAPWFAVGSQPVFSGWPPMHAWSAKDLTADSSTLSVSATVGGSWRTGVSTRIQRRYRRGLALRKGDPCRFRWDQRRRYDRLPRGPAGQAGLSFSQSGRQVGA